jgi:hypothetical protein
MRMKIISFLACVVLMTTALPLTNAIDEINTEGVVNQNDSIAKRRVFTTCYIEASGPVNHMWKTFWLRPFGGDIAFISYWAISFREPDVQVTIYNRENGRVLWQSENDLGQWGLKLVGYFGIYTNPPVDDGLGINLRGKAMIAITITE